MSIESVMPSNHLILCHPLFPLPSIFPSIRVFSDESVLFIRWPKYWSFSFTIYNHFGAQEKKSVTVSIASQSICHEVMGPDTMIFVFWMLSFKPTFSLSSFTFIKRLFSSSLSAIRVVSSAYVSYWYFSWQSWFQLVLPPAQHFLWCTLHIS